jgi:hypothetical protein
VRRPEVLQLDGGGLAPGAGALHALPGEEEVAGQLGGEEVVVGGLQSFVFSSGTCGGRT